ncbi:YqaE/Pmp3 family membrane protein [Paenibacillus sp. 1P03SA]|uniref:YqaE/Pmp3 family membrane protein n=1 Tax=Paenibacillus sp. 1P03SA TaxID=3132294 RepID=UPI00399F8D0C
MRYLLAIILPPVAVLLCGKPIQALINFLLCLCLLVPGIIHAFAVVSSHKADKRNDKLIKAISQNGQAQ